MRSSDAFLQRDQSSIFNIQYPIFNLQLSRCKPSILPVLSKTALVIVIVSFFRKTDKKNKNEVEHERYLKGQIFNLQYPISNIQYPIFNIQFSIFNPI